MLTHKMDSTLLIIVFWLLRSAASNKDVCLYTENSVTEKFCTDSLRSVMERLNVTNLVPNSSCIVIELQGTIQVNDTIEFENSRKEATQLKIDGKGNEIVCTNHQNSGLYFSGVQNLQLINLTIRYCGSLQESTTEDVDTKDSNVKFLSGVYIINCTNVTLESLTITNSSGTGVTFFDTFGTVTVTNSAFVGNLVNSNSPYPGGNGVYIEFTYCSPGIYGSCNNRSGQNPFSTVTVYSIAKCVFKDNVAETLQPNRTSYVLGTQGKFQGFGRGGGLAIMFKGYHSDITVGISDCEFHNNTAYWGGGLYAVFRDRSNNNKVTIEGSKFVKNCVKLNGGGGAKVGFLAYSSIDSFSNATNNIIKMINCTFESNRAEQYGGGISLVASKGLQNNIFEFRHCKWIKNEAQTAAAVDISPGVWSILGYGVAPSTTFIDCSFTQNIVKPVPNEIGPGIAQEKKGTGTFLATSFHLKFEGDTEFLNNNGTALYLTSASVTFASNSNVLFRENHGRNGGAVALIAFSVLFLEDNTAVSFERNTAQRRGGAIYTFSVETHLSSHSCFIQYHGTTILKEKRNISVHFINNTVVSHMGHTLYTTSLLPCHKHCETDGVDHHSTYSSYTHTFDCVGDVYIMDTGLNNSIATRKGKVEYKSVPDSVLSTKPYYYELIPGKDFDMPITTLDELDQEQDRVYDIVFIPTSNSLSQSLMTHRTSNSKINLARVAGVVQSGKLTYENYDISVSVDVKISKCPPGYKLMEERGECDCVQAHYKGLWRCDDSEMQAYILHGYWIGKCENQICVAHCPIGFCAYKGSAEEYQLPNHIDELEKYVCGSTRRGTLCTMCNDNLSVYFHSIFYRCGENTNCKYGIPLYIISELLPLLLIFVFIIAFDISFTSGYLNGFILYAQLLDSLIIAQGATKHMLQARTLTAIYQLIYRPLNLDFFDSFESLSFCIWEGAQVMDILAMKYVTILCALVLVIVTVFLWNTKLCARLLKCSCCHHRTIKNAVIHGLSAFFVMCYSQCAQVSFQILGLAVLYGYDNEQLNVVAFRAGDQKYFHGRHLIYAIPATLSLMTLVAIPPLLLLAYPLVFKILSKCNLSEFKPVLFLSRLIPMQLLDSFQSCFKDNCRYFAGLYFLYRTMILATRTFVPSIFYVYICIELQLIIILSLHSAVQPYKISTHNKIDSAIFANLAIINTLSLINLFISRLGNDTGSFDISNNILQANIYIQITLIFLPFLCVLTYIFTKAAHLIHGMCKELSVFKKDRSWESLDSTELPSLREPDQRELNYNYAAYPCNKESSN